MQKAVAGVVVLLCLGLPGAAMAGTVSLDLEQSDLGPGVMVENLNYRAGPGEENRLSLTYDGSSAYTVVDAAGVTPGRNCLGFGATRVTCTRTPGTRLGGVLVSLGDRNDRATVTGRGAVVLGGRGSDLLKGSGLADTLSAGDSTISTARAHTRDRLAGRGGDDLLRGSRGDNRMDGGTGHDVISAGRGDDLIKARDKRVDEVRCGGGFDRARLDTADFLADRCRAVSRPGTPAATPVTLFTSGFNAYEIVGCPRDALVARCKGSVELSRDGQSFGRERFSLRRGKQVTKVFPLPEDVRNQIGPDGGPTVRIRVRSRSRAHRIKTFTVRQALPAPGD